MIAKFLFGCYTIAFVVNGINYFKKLDNNDTNRDTNV